MFCRLPSFRSFCFAPFARSAASGSVKFFRACFASLYFDHSRDLRFVVGDWAHKQLVQQDDMGDE
jgi:hypothetical protein